MAKQSKVPNFSDIFENIDLEIAGVLRKIDNGKNIDRIKSNERGKFWNSLLTLIKNNSLNEATDDNIQIIKYCIELLLTICNSSQFNVENNIGLIDIIKFLNSGDFKLDSTVLFNWISKINEYWLAKLETTVSIPEIEYCTLKHLLNMCTVEKPLMSDIQRLSSIRKAITPAPFESMVPSLKPLLIKLVQSNIILGSEHGQRFLAQALLLSNKQLLDIHKTVMLDLKSCNKKKAAGYAKIYLLAWHAASTEMKISLQRHCFQHMMETFLREERTSLELNKNSQNLLAVFDVWHSERKKKHPGYVTMITDAYQPILWKYFQSGFNMHRCNASDLFFKAFPLQRSEDDSVAAEKLFNMQYESMLSTLTDDCHIVRIIGIREVCNILSHYWNSFNSVQIQTLLSVITKQDASDASAAEVRKMVYVGMQSLVKSPLSREYIKKVLPNLANNIHDVNQKVRIAFLQLLISIKDLKDPDFKYSDVVSMPHLQYRLADDNAVVGQWIVKLLMKNYYHSKMSVMEWTKRFIYLIKTYGNSYRNFFFYSSRSLPFTDACTIIYEILNQLGMYILSKSDFDKEGNEISIERPVEKREGKKKVPLSESNGRKNSSEKIVSKKCAFDEPEVVIGLFDIVTILWVLHNIKLNKPENEDMRLKLYDTYIKYAQPFINYYKDCDLFLGVISLSGNIPASLLRHNSITLPGYCIKMLKSFNMDGSAEDKEKVICMLSALVKWGRGAEILEQVTLWLDAAFETQDMNETILPRRRVRINEAVQPNSIVAIHILDVLFKREYAKLSILQKNYQELFHLWKFMSRIQQLIANRMDLGEPFSEDLVSDSFLILCFRRYVKMIPLLKGENNLEEEKENHSQSKANESQNCFINHQKEIESIIEWADNLFYPLLQQEELDEVNVHLIVSILEEALYVADNMIIIHLVNNSFQFKVCHFIIKLLNTKYATYLVKSCSRIAVVVSHSAKLLFHVSDDLRIFSTVIPSLLSHSLHVLSRGHFSKEELDKLQEDLPIIKTNYAKILATYQDNLKSGPNLKEKARQLKLIVSMFSDAINSLIVENIPREDSVIPVYSSPAQLPPIANCLITLFHNKKSWTSLFLLILKTKLGANRIEVKNTLAYILIIHMYAVSDKKVCKEEILGILSLASNNLMKAKEPLKNNGVEDTPKSVEKTFTPMISCAKKRTPLMASTVQLSGNNENVSKEELNSFGDNERCEEDVGKFISLNKSQSPEEDSQEDLIECGLVLIKNIENLLKINSNGEM